MTNKHMAHILEQDQAQFAKVQAIRTLRQEIVNAAIVCGVEADVANAWMDVDESAFMDTIVNALGEDKCGEVLAHIKGPQ